MEYKTEKIDGDIRTLLHAGRVSASLRLLRQWRSTLTSADGLCPGEVLVCLAVAAPQGEMELDAALSLVWSDRRLRTRFIERHGLTVLGLLHGAHAAEHDKALVSQKLNMRRQAKI